MRLLIVITTIVALLACSEAWSLDLHIDGGTEHVIDVGGSHPDDHNGEVADGCCHVHCHHLAMLPQLPYPCPSMADRVGLASRTVQDQVTPGTPLRPPIS